MSTYRRMAALLVGLGLFGLVAPAMAQTPPAQPGAGQGQPSERKYSDVPGEGTPSTGSPSSILRQPQPWPYQPKPRSTWGYRNPGGVGRHAEYYPPGDQFQNPGTARTAGEFSNSTALPGNRQEQLQAQNAGTMRYNAMQSHIDRYGHPFGYGYGFGMGWGFGFN